MFGLNLRCNIKSWPTRKKGEGIEGMEGEEGATIPRAPLSPEPDTLNAPPVRY